MKYNNKEHNYETYHILTFFPLSAQSLSSTYKRSKFLFEKGNY